MQPGTDHQPLRHQALIVSLVEHRRTENRHLQLGHQPIKIILLSSRARSSLQIKTKGTGTLPPPVRASQLPRIKFPSTVYRILIPGGMPQSHHIAQAVRMEDDIKPGSTHVCTLFYNLFYLFFTNHKIY